MKKFSKKGLLLFAGAMAVCAFAMPAMASASSWGTIGTHHVLTSTNLGFSSDATGTQSMCTGASFTARVTSAANLEITAGGFSGCQLAAPSLGATCTATSTGTSFPWTATAVTTSNIQIHGVDIDIPLEGASCGPLASQNLRVTGTLSLGRWTGNGVGQHSVEVLGGTGLVSHAPALFGGTNAITPTGTITDTAHTLTVTG
jgi:hypothetical protein